MQLTEMSVMGFRTSVTVFRRPAGGLRWVIIPTIHMGHADYYWAIWQRLRSCQAVVAEIWDGPSSTGMAYANAMRLARQRASRDLVPQDIDYGALGVPIIFPDDYLAPKADPDRRMLRRRVDQSIEPDRGGSSRVPESSVTRNPGCDAIADNYDVAGQWRDQVKVPRRMGLLGDVVHAVDARLVSVRLCFGGGETAAFPVESERATNSTEADQSRPGDHGTRTPKPAPPARSTMTDGADSARDLPRRSHPACGGGVPAPQKRRRTRRRSR